MKRAGQKKRKRFLLLVSVRVPYVYIDPRRRISGLQMYSSEVCRTEEKKLDMEKQTLYVRLYLYVRHLCTDRCTLREHKHMSTPPHVFIYTRVGAHTRHSHAASYLSPAASCGDERTRATLWRTGPGCLTRPKETSIQLIRQSSRI